MNSYKKLIGNSFIFAVGNLGSKLISFILVPVYTYYLSTAEYGTVDLVTATVTMLLPMVSLSVFEAVLRFVMDKDKPKEVILTNSIFIALVCFIVAILFYPILVFFDILQNSLSFLYLILFLQMFERIFAQYTRGIGKIKVFAINGILLTFTTGLFNILFLVYLELGVPGYLWAMVVSNFISVLFLIIATKSYKSVRRSNLDLNLSKKMLSYSIPMIPNSLMWWLINASSRYFIRFFVGVSGNGLFAVASKIPSLITLINQIFTQAWQLSAIEEYENKNKSTFYSNVFSYLVAVLFIGTSILLIIIKFVFSTFFAADYFEAWQVTPFLILGAVFSSFSGFLGTNYIAAKQTTGVFKTSVYGGIISIILNLIFIPSLGIVGAGISSAISFFVMFILRYFDTKQYIKMEIDWKRLLIGLTIIIIQILILFLNLPKINEWIFELILLLALIFINRNLIKPIFKMLKKSK